jgi:hypothetical protein
MSFDPIAYSKIKQLKKNLPLVKTPTLLNLSNGQTGVAPGIEIQCSSYAPLYTTELREKRIFQIIELPGGSFSFPDYELEDDVDNYTPGLADDTIFRMRFKDVSVNGNESTWSQTYEFATLSGYTVEPSISVTGYPNNVPESCTLEGGDFLSYGGTDTHIESQWRAVRVGDSSIIWEDTVSSGDLTQITIPYGQLSDEIEYRFEVRYNGNTFGWSSWGSVVATTKFYNILTPQFTSHIDEETGVPPTTTFIISEFETDPDGGDSHLNTDWQIATDSEFSNIVDESLADDTNLTSWTVTGLDGVEHYVRARQRAISIGASQWSVISINVGEAIEPTFSITGFPNNVPDRPTITNSAFVVDPVGSDTHYKTDWQILDMSDNILWEDSVEVGMVLAPQFTNLFEGQIIDEDPVIQSSEFEPVPEGSDIHEMTEWEVIKVSDSSVVWDDSIQIEMVIAPQFTNMFEGEIIDEDPLVSFSDFESVPEGTDIHVSTDFEIRDNLDALVYNENITT